MDFFWRERPWYASQFMRKIDLKSTIKPGAEIFITAALNKLKEDLKIVLVRNVEKTFLNSKIQLPMGLDGRPDFDVMADLVHNLQRSKLSLLDKYLEENNLSNPALSPEEIHVLETLPYTKWIDFKMSDLFEKVAVKKLGYKAKDLPKNPSSSFNVPCLTSSFLNQGLNYYVDSTEATIISDAISIPSNSDVYRAYYQPRDFTVLSDAYAIKSKDKTVTGNAKLFAVAAINKFSDVDLYSHKQKLGGWDKVKEMYVKLPVDFNNEVNWDFMDQIISILKKQEILPIVNLTKSRQGIL